MTPRLAARLLAAAMAVALSLGPALGAQDLDKREKQRLLQVGDDALDSARTLTARGDTKAAKQRVAEAEKAYRRILAGEPGNKQANLGLSRALLIDKRFQEGVDLLEPLHAKAPDDPDYTHQLGLHQFQNGRPQDAAKLLERVADDPKRFDAMWLLATYHFQQSGWFEGLPHIERYVKVRPDDKKALGLLGTYYLKLDRFQEAVVALDAFLVVEPKNLAARINRANALFRSSRLVEAGRAYEELLGEEGDRPRLLYNLASVRIKQGRCDQAVALLDRFLKLQPDYATALYFKADCQLQLGRLAEARQTFELAGTGAANNPWVYYGLSQIAFREGQLDEALTQAERAAGLDDSFEITGWLGTLLRRAGRPNEALAWHDKALHKAPERAPLHVERGRDLWALQRLQESLAAFERAATLDPALTDATLGLVTVKTAQAAAARATGDDAAARRGLQEALDRMPTYEPARVNLALLELAAGQVEAAERAIGPSGREDAPSGPDARAVRAMLHLLAGRHEPAQAEIEAATAAGTQLQGLALTVTGHLAAHKGEWARASEAFDEAAALAPGDAAAQRSAAIAALELGLDRLAAGDAGGARAALERALSAKEGLEARDRTLAQLGSAMAAVLAAPGSEGPLGALRQMAEGRALAGPAWASARELAHACVAWSLLRKGDANGALKALAKVRDGGPTAAAITAAAHEQLGHAAYAAKAWAKAIQHWTQAAQAAPSAAMDHNIAAARLASGQAGEAARTWLRQTSDGGPPEALYNLALIRDREGAYREAWDLFRRYATSGRPDAQRARERAERKERLFGFVAGQGVN